MLTAKLIDSLKPKNRQYKAYDMDGLYLMVTPRSVKSWRYNYQENGKYKTKTYGLYPEISLAKARLLNSEYKDHLASPRRTTIPTFRQAAEQWQKVKLKELKNLKHQSIVITSIDKYVMPKLASMPIDELKRSDFVEIVSAIDKADKIETAHRVAMRIKAILDYAVDCGHIESHAASGLSRVLRTPVVKHMNCVSIDDAAALFKAIETYDEPVVRNGLKFMALTFTRTTELRYMRWSEIQDKVFWVIPAERMKLKKPHVVPLCKQAMAILKEMELITGESEFVFESPTRARHPLSENTFLFALYRLGYRGRMTGHGFRALASTVLNQLSGFGSDVIERQLAHKESDAVRAAYNRAEYLPERIKLMHWYGSWIEQSLG